MDRLGSFSQIAAWLVAHGEAARCGEHEVRVEGATPLTIRRWRGRSTLEVVHFFPFAVSGATELVVALGFLRANSTLPVPLLQVDAPSSRPMVRVVLILAGDDAVEPGALGSAVHTCRHAAESLREWVGTLCDADVLASSADPPWWAAEP